MGSRLVLFPVKEFKVNVISNFVTLTFEITQCNSSLDSDMF